MLDLGFETYATAGAVCVEMECSALFIIDTMRRVRTGAIFAIDGDARSAASGDHDPHQDLVHGAVDREICVVLEAVVLLASASRAPPSVRIHPPGTGVDRAARGLGTLHPQRPQGRRISSRRSRVKACPTNAHAPNPKAAERWRSQAMRPHPTIPRLALQASISTDGGAGGSILRPRCAA